MPCISGVGSVSISGAPKREIQVYVDPVRLEAYNLSVETIASIIGAENRNVPGGSFDIGSETYSLRVQGEFADASQMKDIVVGAYNGKPGLFERCCPYSRFSRRTRPREL